MVEISTSIERAGSTFVMTKMQSMGFFCKNEYGIYTEQREFHLRTLREGGSWEWIHESLPTLSVESARGQGTR